MRDVGENGLTCLDPIQYAILFRTLFDRNVEIVLPGLYAPLTPQNADDAYNNLYNKLLPINRDHRKMKKLGIVLPDQFKKVVFPNIAKESNVFTIELEWANNLSQFGFSVWPHEKKDPSESLSTKFSVRTAF